jgi:hypothetical protein
MKLWAAAVAAKAAARPTDHAPTLSREVGEAAIWASVAGGLPPSRPDQAHLLRCILGPLPFRPPPAIEPAWLGWNGGLVPRLAEAAYEERTLPEGTLDPARLAILADALEDAGCTDNAILDHLRGPGPHVRGCWAVDLVLGLC